MKIHVALAEDNYLLAKSIQEKLELFEDTILFQFYAENGKDLLNRLERNHSVDVILMDIEMPEMDGIEATERVAEKYPHIKVIMLTVFDDEQRIFRAIRAGAMGYILKDEPPEKILQSIKMIMAGGAPMSPGIAAKTLHLMRNPKRAMQEPADEKVELSRREMQVLEQISQGMDYQRIANNLYISPATVRKHIENIYRKLNVHNKMHAVRKASRQGLI